MAKYEAAFPTQVPVQAALDLARMLAAGDRGGGKVALAAFNVGGFALRSLFGDGEGLIVGASAPAKVEKQMQQVAEAMTDDERQQIEEAYVQVIGPLPAQVQAKGASPSGSWLSVWVGAVLIPLAKKAFEMLLAMLNEKATT